MRSLSITPLPAQGDVLRINPGGTGQMVVVCEHTSNLIPEEYNNLGLDDDALTSYNEVIVRMNEPYDSGDGVTYTLATIQSRVAYPTW